MKMLGREEKWLEKKRRRRKRWSKIWCKMTQLPLKRFLRLNNNRGMSIQGVDSKLITENSQITTLLWVNHNMVELVDTAIITVDHRPNSLTLTSSSKISTLIWEAISLWWLEDQVLLIQTPIEQLLLALTWCLSPSSSHRIQMFQ